MASVGYRVDFVLLAGSLPYQGSPRREQASNRQSHHQLRLRGLFTSTWDAQAVCCCTCALDESDLPSSSISALSDALQLEPYLHPSPLRGCGGSGFSGSPKIRPLPGESIKDRGLYFEWHLPCKRMPRKSWVDSGCAWNRTGSDLLPVFTRPRFRVTPPETAVNLKSVDPEAVSRWHMLTSTALTYAVTCYNTWSVY